jgi:hypothetical protein
VLVLVVLSAFAIETYTMSLLIILVINTMTTPYVSTTHPKADSSPAFPSG